MTIAPQNCLLSSVIWKWWANTGVLADAHLAKEFRHRITSWKSDASQGFIEGISLIITDTVSAIRSWIFCCMQGEIKYLMFIWPTTFLSLSVPKDLCRRKFCIFGKPSSVFSTVGEMKPRNLDFLTILFSNCNLNRFYYIRQLLSAMGLVYLADRILAKMFRNLSRSILNVYASKSFRLSFTLNCVFKSAYDLTMIWNWLVLKHRVEI